MIEVKHLTKAYSGCKAVDDISFTAQPRGILGFLGKNGAGKSTTMNMITGYTAPDQGEVRVCGVDIARNWEQAKYHMGYLPEQPPLYTDLTVEEYLRYACRVKQVRPKQITSHVEELCGRTGIQHVQKRLIQNLSKGYRQRVGLANALVGNPEVLLLDEPSVGLDPEQMMEMRECIRTLGKDHTVVLSSHILSEVVQVCDHLIILEQGSIVAEDSIESLLHSSHEMRYLLRIKGDAKAAEASIGAVEGILEVRVREDLTLCLTIATAQQEATLERLFYACNALHFPILGLEILKESLEDIFLRLTGGKGGDADAGYMQK